MLPARGTRCPKHIDAVYSLQQLSSSELNEGLMKGRDTAQWCWLHKVISLNYSANGPLPMGLAGLINRPSLLLGCSKHHTNQEGRCTSPRMHPGAGCRWSITGQPAHLPVQPLPRHHASASPQDLLGVC